MNMQGNMGQLINLPQTYMYIYCQHLKTCWSVTCAHGDTKRIPDPLSWFTDPILPVTILNYNQKKATAQIAYNPTFLTSSFFLSASQKAFTDYCWSDCQTYISCQILISDLKRGLHR